MCVQLLSPLLHAASLSDMHVCTAPFAVASCSFFIGHSCVYSSFRRCFMQLLYRTCTCVQLLSLLLHAAFLSDIHVCTAPFAVASCSFFIGHARVYSSFRCCFMQLFYRTFMCVQLLSPLLHAASLSDMHMCTAP